MTNATADEESDLYRAYLACQWPVSVILGVILIVGVIGNTLVIFTVLRQRTHRAVTYYYIVNLAVTDLAFLICCVPITALEELILPTYVFGDFLCKFTAFMKQVTGLATCTTLTAMTIDRYRAIVHPFKSLQSRTAQKAVVVSLAIWAGSCFLSLPFLIYKHTEWVEPYNAHVCIATWPTETFRTVYFVGTLLMVYVIPISIIGVCYVILLRKLWGYSISERETGSNGASRARMMSRKRHITFIILIVILIFALSWFPRHAYNMWSMRHAPTATGMYVNYFSLCLAYSNSSVNPFVYAFVGGKFRERVRYACSHFCPYTISRQETMPLSPMAKYGRVASGLGSTRRTKLQNSSENTDTTRDALQQQQSK